MPLDSNLLLEKLSARFGNHIYGHEMPYNMLTLTCNANSNIEMLDFLYHEAGLEFQYLTDLTAVHYPDAELQLQVVYHLHSLTTNTRIRLKFGIPISNPTIRSATGLYAAANWMERETFDFFGVQFEGHPNLKRILNVDEMTVFPMRKEYPLEDPNRVDKKDYFFGR